jgi:hypothetical protein
MISENRKIVDTTDHKNFNGKYFHIIQPLYDYRDYFVKVKDVRKGPDHIYHVDCYKYVVYSNDLSEKSAFYNSTIDSGYMDEWYELTPDEIKQIEEA